MTNENILLPHINYTTANKICDIRYDPKNLLNL